VVASTATEIGRSFRAIAKELQFVIYVNPDILKAP
jgi:hypothetical protein